MEQVKNYKKIFDEYNEISKASLKDLFNADSARAQKYTINIKDKIFIDYSKNHISDSIRANFIETFKDMGLDNKLSQMWSAGKINFTENRAVGHIALRGSVDKFVVDGHDYVKDVNDTLKKMELFANKFRSGEFSGYSGKRLKNIVHIGIGGSFLGVQMIYNALSYQLGDIKAQFVSNVDASSLVEVLKNSNPEETLFVIASKTFTTQETIANANSARDWLMKHYNGEKSAIARHFIALSTNAPKVQEFGIDVNNMFEFWDFVGGRFSSWSAIGITIALVYGFDEFKKLLEGAREMDNHFMSAPYENNAPFIMAIVGILYRNFDSFSSHAIMCYDHYLRDFTRFLQQLEMESNGKSINSRSQKINYSSSYVIFGEPGTDSQHSYFQMLHQGSDRVLTDFIGVINTHNKLGNHHNMLLSNLLAQTRALAFGKTKQEVEDEFKGLGVPLKEVESLVPHKVFDGNRPSTTILLDTLDAYTLGMLMALYEHKVLVQGLFWEINSFDQWGVELGKQLANSILRNLNDSSLEAGYDSSTNGLLDLIKKYKRD